MTLADVDRRPSRLLVVHCALIGVVFALPGIFVIARAGQLGTDLVDTVSSALEPLGRTVILATSVSVTSAALGTILAWLVVRTDVPGRRIWRLVLVMPLVLPSFVGAAAFLAALAPGGLLHEMLDVVGIDAPRLRGFWPSWLLLSLFTYPYVLLPVSARLGTLRPTLEESARLLGSSTRHTFLTITLPQLRPAILTSALLVFLYTVSEFGAVQLLGYDTLTRVIFATRLADRGTSFTAAALLIALALVVVGLSRRYGTSDRIDDRVRMRRAEPVHLGRARLPAFLMIVIVTFMGVVAPVASLTIWAARGIADGRVGLGDLLQPAANTTFTGVVTAVLAVAVVLPLAVLLVRYRSPTGRVAAVAIVGGFAVPGIVIAISLVFWALNTPAFDWLYQTWPLLLIAYVIHFGSQALGAAESAVRAVPRSLRESSQLLEQSAGRRLLEVDYPLMRSGLVSGGGLVLLSTVKELPATLLLAPIGFETLATKIWGSYQDGFYAEVGVSSLLLIAVSSLLTWWLVLRPINHRHLTG